MCSLELGSFCKTISIKVMPFAVLPVKPFEMYILIAIFVFNLATDVFGERGRTILGEYVLLGLSFILSTSLSRFGKLNVNAKAC